MRVGEIRQFCVLQAEGQSLMRSAMTQLNLSARAYHEQIAEALHLKFYFAHPYAAWERGTNENTNGLLRQYFPKKHDFQSVSNKEIAQAMSRLNFRPRKSLRFKTPFEVFYHLSVAFTN